MRVQRGTNSAKQFPVDQGTILFVDSLNEDLCMSLCKYTLEQRPKGDMKGLGFLKIAINYIWDSIATYDFWVDATEKKSFFPCNFQMEEYRDYFLQIFLSES